MTQETIESKTFQEAFMRVAKMDQANGSDHTVEDLGNVMDDLQQKRDDGSASKWCLECQWNR